jgi:hypothetical protein
MTWATPTKLRSIFSAETGRSRRWASELYPVPKSSIATRKPCSRRSRSSPTATSVFCMIAVSVISRTSWVAGRPDASVQLTRSSRRVVPVRLAADRFTAR